jgi:hypothetical protein
MPVNKVQAILVGNLRISKPSQVGSLTLPQWFESEPRAKDVAIRHHLTWKPTQELRQASRDSSGGKVFRWAEDPLFQSLPTGSTGME